MFDLLRKMWRTGTVTKRNLFEQAPERFRGKPVFVAKEQYSAPCASCLSCVTACPADAIQWMPMEEGAGTLRLSYASCIFCGVCAEVCDPGLIRISNEYRLANKDKQALTAVLSVGR
jgi:formate hydrogenlyase subunit 6/NADH:ubiquinone oxidoreductase subunit I